MRWQTNTMKLRLSILTTLIVVLGFVREAGAAEYQFCWRQQYYGIADVLFEYCEKIDVNGNFANPTGQFEMITVIQFGPYYYAHAPFTATQGFVGFCLIVAAFIALLIALSVRWKKKQSMAVTA
jgi:hypothetical protein